MERKLLKLVPNRFLCPYCGEWHDWDEWNLEFHDSINYAARLSCSNLPYEGNPGDYRIYFLNDHCYFYTDPICAKANLSMEGKIPISSIIESADRPIVTFEVPFTAKHDVGSDECSICRCKSICNCVKLGDEGDNRHMNITFGFEFDREDYDEISNVALLKRKEKELEERQAALDLIESRETIIMQNKSILKQTKNMEDSTMKKTTQTTQVTKTTIWDQLYKHAPEENVEILKEWANKYKPTLKWAVPVLSIYAAYRILNSRNSNLTVENIDSECKKKLGFSLDLLKDKKALSELMVIGGLSAGAYAAIKAVSSIYKKDDETDVSVEEIEEGMDKLDGISKKFSFIQPKTEALLPIATSVIIVYVMTQKPKWFEVVKDKANKLGGNLSTKASVYLEMVKLFAADKLNIDLNNEEDAQKFKKFALLGAIVGVGALVYGKKIFGDKAVFEDGEVKGQRNEKLEAFVSQILSIMEDLMPTAFAGATTYLVTKHVLKVKEDVVDVEVNEECFSGETEEHATPECKETVPASTKEVDDK